MKFKIDDPVLIEPFGLVPDEHPIVGYVSGTLQNFLETGTDLFIINLTKPLGDQKAILSGATYMELVKPLKTFPRLNSINLIDEIVLLENDIMVVIESFEHDGEDTLFWGTSKDGTEYSFNEDQIKAFANQDFILQ